VAVVENVVFILGSNYLVDVKNAITVIAPVLDIIIVMIFNTKKRYMKSQPNVSDKNVIITFVIRVTQNTAKSATPSKKSRKIQPLITK
jgi:hypothetical protein